MSYRETETQEFDQSFGASVLDAPASARVVKRRTLHNYPGRGFLHMTKAEWRRLPRICKGSWSEGVRNSVHPSHQVRVALIRGASLLPVYIVDSIRIDPPVRPAPQHAPR